MPAHLRALAVVLVMSLAVLWLVRRTAQQAIDPQDYQRRATLWVALTLLVFLTHNYWIYALISTPLLVVFGGRDSNRLSFFFFLLFVVPPFQAEVPGFGVFEKLLQVDHIRWLALAVLLPAYWSLRTRPDTVSFGRTLIDKFVLAYMLLWFVLQVPATTITNLFRISAYLFIDIFLPYYVASRALRDLHDYRDALMSFAVAVLVMSPLAAFELARTWLLYAGLELVLGLPYWGMGNYLARGDGGLLRASVTTGHPIALGYLMAVGVALAVFLRASIPNKRTWWMLMLGLGVGLVAAMSRGPWVGAAAMLVLLLVTGPKVASKTMQAMLWSLLAIPVLLSTQQGQKILDYLPFIGTVEAANVEFRQRLMEVCLGVLSHYPFFGALDFMSHPDMEQMRGGDGIIDMVNTYLIVAMSTGAVGLSLFLGPFVLSVLGIVRALRKLHDKEGELHLLGRALLAALVAIMVSIGTLSPILAIPVVYLSVVGMAAGYLRLVEVALAEVADPAGTPSSHWASVPSNQEQPSGQY